MTHDELIEAVAQSMRDAYGVACGEVWVKWAKADESKKNEWRQMARAAIRVIAPAVEQETIVEIVAWLRENSAEICDWSPPTIAAAIIDREWK